VSLKSPLIIKAPWSKGNKTQNLVEFVDIYPTIVDLVGLEIPEHCEGKSIVTLMKNPDVKWQNEVFAWWRNGLTIRTQQYQYTEWMNEKTLERQARMLFDHSVDPEENVNVAEAPEYREVADSLSARIRQWWNEYPNK
jgi:iduronate 2-sulfatase